MKVLLDLSSYAWKCLLAGQDKENGYYYTGEDGKETFINTAAYGLDNLTGSISRLADALGFTPKDMILVLDGAGGRALRTQFHSGYKGKCDKSLAMYTEYNNLELQFCAEMLSLGAQVVTQKGVEADDVIGWFCENLTTEPVLVLTHDKDLLVCAKHPHVTVYIQEQANPDLFGGTPFEFIDVYKATVGDPSDNIPGAKGFGEKAFASMLARYGSNGLAVLRKLIQTKRLKDLEEDVPNLPSLQKLIDYAPDVEMSLKCAKLYTDYVQPEKLEWKHGMCYPGHVPHFNLRRFAQKVVGVTDDNFEFVFDEIKQLVAGQDKVVLDIETSTPYESDEWLFDTKGKEGVGVDVFGSELTGLGLTLGDNFQHSYYFSVDHAGTRNISLQQMEAVLKYLDERCRFVIHNVNFELPVLHNTFGWFLRDVDDTQLMASYVDENESLGLKKNSARWLEYKQASYEDTVTDDTGRRRKMNELTLAEVLSYGSDDTICTAALYQWFKLHMDIEGAWQTYRDVEIGAAYWVAQAFIDGVTIDKLVLRDMIRRDAAFKEERMQVVDEYLMTQGWEGTSFVEATEDNRHDVAWIKAAFAIVYGKELETRVRKFDRVLEAVREQAPDSTLPTLLEHGTCQQLNDLLKTKFDGRPEFNVGSPKQMQRLLYEVMGLPIRLRNKPTDLMRAAGKEGTPQTDELAIQSAIHYDLAPDDVRTEALKALLDVKSMQTREGLYYKSYPHLPHWKDGKIHASLNQCATVTRRFTSSGPNLQQLSKGAGDFRRIFVPHHNNAMIVSLDFSAQELRLIAEQSQDPNMLACYVGDDLKDMHSLTGAGIAKMPYDEFKAIIDDESHPRYKEMKGYRATGKTVNFASSYGAAAPKMAQTLMCSGEEAQAYLDAKFTTFAGVEDWKRRVEKEAHDTGYALTMLGARRHLNNLSSQDKWQVAKAERQAGNFCIQGSGAEMTKLAMCRMWESKLRERYDIRFFAPIHDEVVFSINVLDMPQAIPEIHAAMTAPYATMQVPIESSVSMGWNFGDQHEMGDGVRPTPENVQQMIDKLMAEKSAA